jgi:Rrf2 family protein
MQLNLMRKSDYSILAMIYVARRDGDGLSQARQIAAEMDIPYKFLTQILANLVAEGLLEATRGPAGGYRLARPGAQITLLDVVEAAEGPAAVTDCALREGPCEVAQPCAVHDTWVRAQGALARELASTTLAELAAH